MTTKAQEVQAQITAHFAPETPSPWLLSNDLRDGRIAKKVPMCHKHDGFNSPQNYEEAIPLVMYFDDDSILIVTMDRVFCAKESG